jgi:hypothetical protein
VLLCPHKRDLGTRRGATEEGGTENIHAESQLEALEDLKLSLVLVMSPFCPTVRHIKEAHSLETKEFPVVGSGKFSF